MRQNAARSERVWRDAASDGYLGDASDARDDEERR